MIDEKNEKLIEEFLLKSEAKGEIAETTVDKYRDLLSRFFRTAGKSIFDLTVEDYDNFIIQKKKQKKPVEATTLQTYGYALRKFVAYVKKKGTDLKIDVIDIEIPKDKRKRKPVYLTDEEVLHFLATILEDGTELRVVRFYALVRLLLDTGARISEALSVKVKDIDWKRGEVDIIGKCNRERTLMFKGEAAQWLKRYLIMRKSDNECLFTTIDGKRQWKKFEIDDLFRKYARKSGIAKRITAHTMRRTFATHLASKGVGTPVITYLLGHKSMQTTIEHYLGEPTLEEVRKKMTDDLYKFIPESDLKKSGYQEGAGSAGAGNSNSLPRTCSWDRVPRPI